MVHKVESRQADTPTNRVVDVLHATYATGFNVRSGRFALHTPLLGVLLGYAATSYSYILSFPFPIKKRDKNAKQRITELAFQAIDFIHSNHCIAELF
jgi:hypothetical protein